MRDQDLELIAALVEGRLDDETEARALVESAPEFRSEYEAQKVAFEALAPVATARLSQTEKAALHRDIWTELRSDQSAQRKTTSPWYFRWAPVAAGMFVVVGLVAVINQGGSFDAGEDASVVAAQDSVTSTAADATEADGSDQDSSVGNGTDAAQGGSAAEEAPQNEAIDEMAADFARALTATEQQFFTEEAAKIRSGDLTGAELSTFDEESPSNDLQTCVETAGLSGYDVVGVSISPFVTGEGAESLPDDLSPFIAAIPEGATLEEAPIAFVDLLGCELVHVDG